MLLDHVAVALAATGRNENRELAFDVAGVGDGEAAVDRLGDGHDFEQVCYLFKCDALHVACVPLQLVGLSSR